MKPTKIQNRIPRVQGNSELPELLEQSGKLERVEELQYIYRRGAAGERYQVSEGRCGVNSGKAMCPGD